MKKSKIKNHLRMLGLIAGLALLNISFLTSKSDMGSLAFASKGDRVELTDKLTVSDLKNCGLGKTFLFQRSKLRLIRMKFQVKRYLLKLIVLPKQAYQRVVVMSVRKTYNYFKAKNGKPLKN